MMLGRWCLYGLIFFLSPSYAASYPVQLGNEKVIIQKESFKAGPTFIHLHQNEKTALKAARVVAKEKGGSVITLIHHGGRNITFHLKGKKYSFDPNRIFTENGIKKTMKEEGAYSSEAHRKVRILASKIKSLLPKNNKVIAVHNNTSYSLKNYYRGHKLAKEARELHVNQKQSFRNFYLVTQTKDYAYLKRLKYNSILQTKHPKDDGSLSIYLASHSYVNVEAAHGQLTKQIDMLRQLTI